MGQGRTLSHRTLYLSPENGNTENGNTENGNTENGNTDMEIASSLMKIVSFDVFDAEDKLPRARTKQDFATHPSLYLCYFLPFSSIFQ